MAKDTLAIRERRFRLVLWLADNKLEKRQKALCELAEVGATFALNSIPVANIIPLLGKWVNTGKEKHADLDIVLALTKARAPVIITAQLVHSFSSKSNSVDKQYWSKMPKGSPDAFGLYSAEPVEIFKGYLQPATAEVTAVNAGLSIQVVHWLSDLAEVALYTTNCQLGTPAELAFQMYGINPEAGKWVIPLPIKLQDDGGAIWYDGIKPVFERVIELEEDKNNSFYRFIKEKKERVKLAIDRIVPHASLKLRHEWAGGRQSLSHAISDCLSQESLQQFVQTSAWDRLVGYYSPTFLFSVLPRVSSALLIPTPCIVYKDENIEITNSEIFRIRSAPVSSNQIARIICIPSSPTDPTGSIAGKPRYINVGQYPKDEDMMDQQGYVKLVAWPSWITTALHIMQPNVPAQINVNINNGKKLDNARKNANDNRAKDNNLVETQNFLGFCYAQYSYLVNAFNTTSAVLVTPVRLDVAPGAMVKFHTKVFGDNDTVFYGTVVSMQYHFTAGESPCTTTLALTNIKDAKTVDDEVKNPQTPVGFYERQYTGVSK